MQERRRRGRKAQTLEPDELERLAGIRADAGQSWTEIVANGPDDVLGSVAWLTGILGPTPYDPTPLVEAIDRARGQGFTWRQLAMAMGEGDNLEAVRRVRDRRQRWTAT